MSPVLPLLKRATVLSCSQEPVHTLLPGPSELTVADYLGGHLRGMWQTLALD